ncbi:hypothetical protein YC2023_018828 [Brassica napus]
MTALRNWESLRVAKGRADTWRESPPFPERRGQPKKADTSTLFTKKIGVDLELLSKERVHHMRDSGDVETKPESKELAESNNPRKHQTTWAEPNSLFDLFLESFRIGQGTQQLLKHVVVVCLDGKAFERCSQLHPNCYHIETTETDFSGEKVYNTPDYLKMMWRRIELLTQVLQMGFNFIFTDADIMWLRDPFPRLYPDGDFQMACDRFFGNPFDSDNWVNGGFTYVRSNNRSIEFYKFWHKSRLDYPELHDQDVFNRIKHMPYITEIGIQMRFFDTVYFGGFCQTSRDINLVCTMHANCCIGLEKKLHDLNLVLDDWRKYLSLSEHVQNTTWSAPMKCLED